MTFQILSLSGGGYLGLFAAYIVAQVEEEIGEPIARRFDLIAGTSIGGIIALGLAAEIPAREILDKFAARGSSIFSDRPKPKGKFAIIRDVLRFLASAKYDAAELRAAVQDVLGERLLGELRHRILVPSVNMTKGSVQIFKTPHHQKFARDYQLPMIDIALATSAAPTFFPLAEIRDSLFIDGGVVANAPDLCALHEATHFLGKRHDEVRILSIGTTTSKFSLAHASGKNFGALDWLAGGRLLSTMIAAQQQLVHNLLSHQLGDSYLRVDIMQSPEQEADLALDVATAHATRTIRGMADGAYQDVAANYRFREMLAYEASAPTFFHGPHALRTG